MIRRQQIVATFYILTFLTFFTISSGYTDIFDLAKDLIYGSNEAKSNDVPQATNVAVEEKLIDIAFEKNSEPKIIQKFFSVEETSEASIPQKRKHRRLLQTGDKGDQR